MKKIVSLLLSVCCCFALFGVFIACGHTHEAGDWVVTVEPTCTQEGERVKYCSDCNEVVESESIKKLSHEIEGGWKITKESTCSSPGKKEKFCACGLSMEEDVISIDPYNHVNRTWAITTPATCSTTGLQDEYCLDCGKILRTDVEVPKDSNLHAFDILTNSCSLCGEKELTEITSFNALSETNDSKVVILLDYVVAAPLYMTFDAAVEYVRFVGTPNKAYSVALKVASRQTPISFDFVNATICGCGDSPTITCESNIEMNIGFYGEKSAIIGSTGAQGTDGGPFRQGGGGYCAISLPGDLSLTIAATSCAITGGNGGRGGNGSIGNDGGNGGDGAYAIYTESSIKATFKEGYTKDNFSIAGGSGGAGGAAGGWFVYTPVNGSSGAAAAATNVEIYYY